VKVFKKKESGGRLVALLPSEESGSYCISCYADFTKDYIDSVLLICGERYEGP